MKIEHLEAKIEEAIQDNNVGTLDLILTQHKDLAPSALRPILEDSRLDCLEAVIKHISPNYNWQEALQIAAVYSNTEILMRLIPFAQNQEELEELLEVVAIEGSLEKVQALLPHCLPLTEGKRRLDWEYMLEPCRKYIQDMDHIFKEKKSLEDILPPSTKPGVVKKI